jgi:glyoxylase-like metal-dependent hydrolase (beta-lactamase superfamily II)
MGTNRKVAFSAVALAAIFSFGNPAGAQNLPYQHVPLPKELPKGVSVEDAQRLQGLIDDYVRQEPLKVTKIADNIYFAKGGPNGNDANVCFVVGTTGVIVVDGKNSAESEKLVLAEIGKITDKPVNMGIILHSDHETGITGLPAGIPLIAQVNAKKEILESKAADALPAAYYPTKTVDKDESVTIDGVKVRFLNWGPAHTSGDLTVYFPDQRVAIVGDIIVTDFGLTMTQIHGPGDNPDLGGSVAGWIEAVKGMLTLNADTYVSGHGDLFTKRDIRTKLLLIQDKYDKMKAMVAQGQSLDDIRVALGEPPPKRNAQGNLPPPDTTGLIYNELTNKP